MSKGPKKVFFTVRRTHGVRRPAYWLPKYALEYVFGIGRWKITMQWLPRKGMFPLRAVTWGTGSPAPPVVFPNLRSRRMKKLSMGAEGGDKLPPLSPESTILKKMPRLCEFLTATAYEDGSARSPGRLWLEQDGFAFTITLFEPTGYARVRLRASTLDDVFNLANAHLGMENAPWEADQYARDKAAQKKKGK
jgi:hypothetical protein